MINIGIFGANGRVGKLLVESLNNDKEAYISSVYVRNNINLNLPQNTLVTNDIEKFIKSSEVIIDFSSPEATQNLLECAIKNPRPIVCGTTGLNKEIYELLSKASLKMPILYSSNMSKGIVLLNKLCSITSKILKNSNIEIIELHHRHKKDSPSGTAISLATSCAQARGLSLDKVRVSGRDGVIGERSDDEIGVMALRGGDIVGRHTIGFYLDGEYIELTHNATSRMTFAKGAIDAAKWLIGQKNSLYHIEDTLDI